MLGGCSEDEYDSECLDDFCTYLSSHPAFYPTLEFSKYLILSGEFLNTASTSS